ncbi:MAG: MBG domain-containing protein [Flavisolibacter sp.]
MRRFLKAVQLSVFISMTVVTTVNAQQLTIRDFALYGANKVQLSTSTAVTGAAIGSSMLVQTTGNSTIAGDIYSGGQINLSNSNTITGSLWAANNNNAQGNILQTGSNAAITGNATVKGSVLISGGFITGSVTLSGTYSGPAPGGGIQSNPTFKVLPSLPLVSTISVGSHNITNSQPITSGSYGDVLLSGNKTLTFSGGGNYYFKSIKNSGNFNNFVFDFQNDANAVIRIYVQGDVDLYKLNITFPNGGDASHVYMEAQGNGATSVDKATAWSISNGASGNKRSIWYGTVYTPNGNINVGQGASEAKVVGALWSGKAINVQSGVSMTAAPLVNDEVIKPFNPPTPGKVSTIIGAELTSLTVNISDEAKKVLVIQDGYVFIEVIVIDGQRSAALSYLLDHGMTDTISNGSNNLIITGKYPIANLLDLNNQGSFINFVRPVYAPLGNSGFIQDAGDTAIGAYLLRNGFKYQGQSIEGAGVKVGVISDSYNTLANSTNNPADKDVETQDLPGLNNPVNSTPVQVLLDYPFGSRSDEGRAMLQIVHDVAPKASLAFRTGFISQGDFAQGILQMQQAGCNVIVDDVTFINEPFLQDGPVAKAIDQVKALGVSYFSSAGNFGNKSYEAVYSPVAAPASFPAGTTAHNFGGGDIYQKITLKPGSYTIALQWEDDIYSLGQTQSGGTKNDFDLYLTDESGNIICGYNRDNTNGDPFEFLAYTVTNTVTQINANILIVRANAGTPSPRIKYIIFRGDAVIAEYNSGTSTIVGHANAAGAIAVGAVNYFNTPAFNTPPLIAPYSSIGGPVGSLNRNKPDLSAPDGVNTSVFMGADIAKDSDPFSNFFGTSAAAPHAAAAAALLIEGRQKYKNETLTPDGVKALLQNAALKFGATNAAGAGLIQPDSAMRTFASPTPLLISLEYPSNITPDNTSGTFTLIVHGDYLTSESQIYIRDEPVTTTFVNNTELTTTITNLEGNPAIKVCTPAKADGDGGCSNTILFFDIPKKTVRIAGNDTTKKFGEQLPAFTSTITVDGVPLANSGLTLADLGLENLTYATNANALSSIGSQYFIKPVRIFDLTNSTDIALLERFTYDTVPGILTIQKLPITVKPNDKTVTYGQPIGAIDFNYNIDPTANLSATDRTNLLNYISTSHQEFLANNYLGLINSMPVTISNGQFVTISNGQQVTISNGQFVTISNGVETPIINPQSVTGYETGVAVVNPYILTPTDLANLSFLVTDYSLQNSRTLSSQTNVVDITQETLLHYNTNPAQTNMITSVQQVNARGLLGTIPLINGQQVTISNGQQVTISNTLHVTISNGQQVTISNGQQVTISNGQQVTISNSLTDPANRLAVVIDQQDVDNGLVSSLKTLNVITGLDAGNQKIIPGALLNDNFAITYAVGNLTINKVPLTVKADDLSKRYGDPNPPLTASYLGFKYGETLATSGLTGTPSLTTTAVQTSPIGTYPINIAAGNLLSSNYNLSFQNGTLTVLDNPCLLTHSPFSSFNNTPKPNTATTLWFNIETKVSGQLAVNGDYLSFSAGTLTLDNIACNPLVNNAPIPNGKIIADNTVTEPITSFDVPTNTWITKVPPGFSSTSDIFITGAIINSSNGFTKKNGASTIVKGIFNSNKSFSDQWNFGMAGYRPTFTYNAIGAPGGVASTNGTYKSGTPISQILNLVGGGTSGGGNNYAGSSSSNDNFTACIVNSAQVVTKAAIKQNGNTSDIETNENIQLMPNPATSSVNISFVPLVSGNTSVLLFSTNGTKVAEVYNGISEKGRMYQKKINISKLAAGVYFIQLQNGGSIQFKKLVIAR